MEIVNFQGEKTVFLAVSQGKELKIQLEIIAKRYENLEEFLKYCSVQLELQIVHEQLELSIKSVSAMPFSV